MKSIDNMEVIALGDLVINKQKPQPNYVKHRPDNTPDNTLRKGLSIDSNGRMSFNPPYYKPDNDRKAIKDTQSQKTEFQVGDVVICRRAETEAFMNFVFRVNDISVNGKLLFGINKNTGAAIMLLARKCDLFDGEFTD